MSGWNNERVAALTKLWADGFSASQIAGRLGGITRNSVISKVHRLGLAGRATTSRSKHSRRIGKHQLHEWHKKKPSPKGKGFGKSPTSPTIQLPPLPLPPPSETDIARIAFIDLEPQHCRFIALKEPAGPFVPQFCGATVVPGLSWCPDHVKRCFSPLKPKPPATPMIAPVVEKEMEAA